MNLKNFNVFYEPWPHIVFDDFLNNQQSKEIIAEIIRNKWESQKNPSQII